MPAMALLIHLVDDPSPAIGEISLLKAISWAEYVESHARRAYGSVTAPEVATAKALLRRIGAGDLPREFSSRDVWRPGWAMLDDREQVAGALRLLVDFDWLAAVTNKDTGGRPGTTYLVNPKGFE